MNIEALKKSYSCLKSNHEKFEKILNTPNLETNGELLWYFNELDISVRVMKDRLTKLESQNDPDNLTNFRDIKKLQKLVSKIEVQIHSDVVKERLGILASLKFKNNKSTLTTPLINKQEKRDKQLKVREGKTDKTDKTKTKRKTKIEEQNKMKLLNIMVKKTSNNNIEMANSKNNKFDNSLKGRFFSSMNKAKDWIKRNPKMTSVIVLVIVGGILLLALIL